MLTREFVEGFKQIEEVFDSCETKEQFNNTKEWALEYVTSERKFQKKKHCFIFRKKIDEIYDVYYYIILGKKFQK